MTPDEARELHKLNNDVQYAMWSVHHVTGRTDQSVEDIIALYPDHEDVVKYLSLKKARDDYAASLT